MAAPKSTRIPLETVARIVELRHEGLSGRRVAEILGISLGSVKKYSPPSGELRNRAPNARNDWLEPHDEYWDVVPIPYYPPDLPDIEWEYLTAYQREYVRAEQVRILFPVAAA